MKPIFIISDATGETAQRIVRATLLHYDDSHVELRMHTRVRVGEEMRRIVEQAGEQSALIVYTIGSTDAREQLGELVQRNDVKSVDLIGRLMTEVGNYLGQQPAGAPGLLRAIGDEYYQRIEAVEFMVKHDDGAEPQELPKADLVLVGISRTSKTPLSVYLAQKGVRVANVPIVLGIDPPVELDKCDQNRVCGLTIAAEDLVRIRSARLKLLSMDRNAAYGRRDHIVKELAYAREIFAAHSSWPVIDVTSKAVEENAADILRIHKDRTGGSGVPHR